MPTHGRGGSEGRARGACGDGANRDERLDRRDLDEELLEYIGVLVRESQGCLDDESIARLVECSASGEGVVEVRLPGGLRASIPCWETPEAWANILHVYCSRDYELLDEYKPRSGWVVVDAGAFIGLYTLRAASLVGPDGLVVALEPYTPSRRILEENVALNGFADRVRVDPRALWVEDGRVELHVACYHGNNSLVAEYVDTLSERCGRSKARAVTLQSLLRDHGLDGIDLLKLDVEGGEVYILDTLDPRLIERLVVEVHPPLVDPYWFAERLADRGFRVDNVVNLDPYRQAIVYARRA